MAEFKLDRFKYNWRGEWTGGTQYLRDDVVRVNGASYVCVITHIADPVFANDLDAILPGSDPVQYQPRWVAMTKGKSFVGTWETATDYNLGDLVLYKGTVWQCIINHTSEDFSTNKDNWEAFASHIEFLGMWQESVEYVRGSVISYGGNAYKCNTGHISQGTLELDQEKWDLFYEGVTYRGKFQEESAEYTVSVTANIENTAFIISGTDSVGVIDDAENPTITITTGNTIKFNLDVAGHPFYIVRAFTNESGGGYDASNNQPGVVNQGITSGTVEWTPDGTQGGTYYYICGTHSGVMYGEIVVENHPTIFQINDIVGYGGSTFRCIETHNTQDTEFKFDPEKFTVEFAGNSFNGDWDPLTYYQQGDIVRYGGYLYYAIQSNYDDQPSRQVEDSTAVNWQLLARSNRLIGDYTSSTQVLTGDIVLRGGQLWVALADINAADGDGSSVDYLEENLWELLVPGKRFVGDWFGGNYNVVETGGLDGTLYNLNEGEAEGNFIEGNYYRVGDVVYYKGTAYTCTEDHIARSNNFPGDNGSGYDYWDVLIQAGQLGALTTKGDLLSYGFSRPENDDLSTVGDVRVAIGEESQVLSVTEDLEAYWRDVEQEADVIHVGQAGIDDNFDSDRGRSLEKPFATVRYACEFVEDNFQPLQPVKIAVQTGRYEEVGPMIVPAGCVVMGDELRSTVVVAARGLPEYQNDFQYVKQYLTRLKIILPFILEGQRIDPQNGNTQTQRLDAPLSDNTGYAAILDLLVDFENDLEAKLESGDNAPVMSGSNDLTSSSSLLTAADNIHLNRRFISEDIYRWLVANYPDVTFTRMRVINDIEHLLRGVRRDLQYSGNYATLVSAQKYANSVNGSQFSDIFRVRDTTGIRQMTTDGLEGTLNPPGVFDLYQRPTGGACVALDPGWGPADERTWIATRSPYIQGVTNLGTRCVGKKVDGALHNGGNKSMTSNDFTQVLSDGIGAWILNNARAELVSVFTYYCQVGYLAEDGGIIRATNGNNSYGDFGSIADGNDPTETPTDIVVNNRKNQAQVESAFAGGGSDEIFVFEYSHCGENYTQADATIVGAGADADVDYTDFRDKAISNFRLINTTGSGSAGGSNYLIRQGAAQITVDASSTIRISATDETQFEAEILGMRVLVVSGKGVGQYGYISAYDNVTRDATIRKDSTGELGWDHILPGYPIVADFDTTTQYRIEARMTVSDPAYESVSYQLTNPRDFADLTFGGDYQVFFNRSGDIGSVGELEGLLPEAAEFTVIKSAKNYTVNLSVPGIGYAVGDTITLNGNQLGGTTPENNITITVTAVTEDSTNSIVSFTSEGTARDGKFVFIANPDVAGTSDDGEEWDEVNLSFSGDYIKVVHGVDRFVAVARDEGRIGFSYTGSDWTTRSLANTESWIDAVHGEGKFVIISGQTNKVNYSTDGLSWDSADIPDNTSGDSSTVAWDAIAYGAGKFVAVSSNFRDSAISLDGITWTRYEEVLPARDNTDIIALAYGNNRFLALHADGQTSYSFDGEVWYAGTTATTPIDVPEYEYVDCKFHQGVFVAIGNTLRLTGDLLPTASDFYSTTEDGVLWTERAFNNPNTFNALVGISKNDQPYWVTLAADNAINGANIFHVGAKAKIRADIFQGKFQNVKIWDPGSNYTSDPTVTVTDTAFITEAEFDVELRNKVLSQPDFVDRGAGYRVSSSTVTITGDGFAEIVPEGNQVVADGIAIIPGPGAQLRFATLPDLNTEDPDDLKLYSAVGAEDLGDDGSGNGTRSVRFTISPTLKNEDNLAHGTAGTLRVRYSQCRITGHDFLDIGTGNFQETNYPDLYAGGAFFTSAPENEVVEINGGRIFYVSTDQDGNFRAGELFSVQQATGIVTISAEFFDLDGLSELALGGVRLGGSGAVVNEFSTDPTFSADSNNVVPTQRAIATFLADRLSVGGENLETNTIIAGRVKIGTEDNVIEMNDQSTLFFNRPVDISGVDAAGNPSFVHGSFIGGLLFTRNVANNS